MKSKNNAFIFHPFDSDITDKLTSKRNGEKRIGEMLSTNIDENTEFVILGINEDIGPQANHGNSGSSNAFNAFLLRFLNMQSNRFFSGKNCTIAGTIDQLSSYSHIDKMRLAVSELDTFVIDVLNNLNLKDQKLIVIGGGHNNAYPIIRYFSEKGQKLNVLNIDPHADCRALEGRHSGNPFSTAITEGHLNSYSVFGLHEQYNNETIYDFLNANDCFYTFFENYIDKKNDLIQDLQTHSMKLQNSIGLEIDLDSIEQMPTSAFTPSGFSINTIRSAIRSFKRNSISYLHLPEGAPKNEYEKTIVGKSLAYLVSDFIKTQKSVTPNLL